MAQASEPKTADRVVQAPATGVVGNQPSQQGFQNVFPQLPKAADLLSAAHLSTHPVDSQGGASAGTRAYEFVAGLGKKIGDKVRLSEAIEWAHEHPYVAGVGFAVGAYCLSIGLTALLGAEVLELGLGEVLVEIIASDVSAVAFASSAAGGVAVSAIFDQQKEGVLAELKRLAWLNKAQPAVRNGPR